MFSNNLGPRSYLPSLSVLLFFLVTLFCLFQTRQSAIQDFGNYYYGSKLLVDGQFSPEIYKDIHYFNSAIRDYGETDFFENYSPVPPFSALFYSPLCMLSAPNAKLVFNLLSLIVFCFSFWRLIKTLQVESPLLLLLPFAMYFPLYNNIFQGQSYLLISGLFIEIYLQTEKGWKLLPALLMAFIISLKIFPGVILLYFLLTKNYRFIGYSVFFFGLLQVLTYSLLPRETVYYWTDIVPRLSQNEVVGPYYFGNQSVYTLLLNLFSADELNNPAPLLNSPLLVSLLESAVTIILLLVVWELRKSSRFLLFAICFLVANLLTGYTTSYSILLLVPLVVVLSSEKKGLWPLISLLVLALSVNIPLSTAEGLHFKYIRLLGLLMVLTLCMYHYSIRLPLKWLPLFILPLFVWRFLSFPTDSAKYYSIQNKQGILYDLRLAGDSLKLLSTMGHYDVVETLPLAGSADTAGLSVQGKTIVLNNEVLYSDRANKKKPFLYKDSLVVFMSDLQQGLGFYKLRQIKLRK